VNISKRLFDLFFSILGLIFLMPLFLIIGLLIKIEDGGPVLFVQERVGYRGRVFKIYKFRTMKVGAQKMGLQITVDGDRRITKIGRILRKYKIDELPQLFNVIKGEMSLVGPRPEVPYYVGFYNDKQKRVLEIMPGITDLASISFINEGEILSRSQDPECEYINNIMEQKIRLNLAYAEKSNILKDFILVLKTVYISFIHKSK